MDKACDSIEIGYEKQAIGDLLKRNCTTGKQPKRGDHEEGHNPIERNDAGEPLHSQGSPIGGAMQDLGGELSAVAERFQQRKEQQEAFDAEIARRKLMDQIAQAEADVAANAAPDGAGPHDAMYGQVDPRNSQVVKPGLFDTLFDDALPKIPKSQRANFARQKEALRAAGSERMAARQIQHRKDYERAELSRVLQTNVNSIAKDDPDDIGTFETARQDGLDFIAKLDLDSQSRLKLVKDWFSTTARASVQTLIAKDPKRAAAMLAHEVSVSESRKDSAQDPRLRDLQPGELQELVRQAHAATASQLIDARTDIDIALQNASTAIASAGTYSGKMPGPEDFTAVYGTEEGRKRFQDFSRKIDVGRQAFGMRIMPTDAIHALLRDAESGQASSQEADQGNHDLLVEAARQNLRARTTDPGGYVRHVFSTVDAAWKDVSKAEGYQGAVVRSVSAQQQLGIEDIQPLPNSVAEDAVMSLIDKDSQREYAVNRNLLGGIPDLALRLSLVKQLIYASAVMMLKI
ncbi:hypothetical protein ABID19_000655 [Mesorhizobium robiniae]|uniref:Uncharacterized protein n=1 Tax=Mesorhizobium robiniae TaxID=559315 RepID=A0ABV2GH63_9HYPH